MPFVFTRTFYLLLGLGLVPLSLAWVGAPFYVLTAVYDLALLVAAIVDYRATEGVGGAEVERRTDERYSMGAENEGEVRVVGRSRRRLRLRLKDEYPSRMRLVGSREAEIEVPPGRSASFAYALYPTARGSYDFGSVVGRIRGRLGLVWKQVA